MIDEYEEDFEKSDEIILDIDLDDTFSLDDSVSDYINEIKKNNNINLNYEEMDYQTNDDYFFKDNLVEEKPKKKKRGTGISKPRDKTVKNEKDYVNKGVLLEQIKQYYKDKELAKLEGKKIKIPDVIVNSILKICQGIFNSRNFYKSAYMKDDLIHWGMYHSLRALENNKYNVDEEKQNPFGFFTTVIRNAGLQEIMKQQKYVNIKKECLSNYKHRTLHDEDVINELNNNIETETYY